MRKRECQYCIIYLNFKKFTFRLFWKYFVHLIFTFSKFFFILYTKNASLRILFLSKKYLQMLFSNFLPFFLPARNWSTGSYGVLYLTKKHDSSWRSPTAVFFKYFLLLKVDWHTVRQIFLRSGDLKIMDESQRLSPAFAFF